MYTSSRSAFLLLLAAAAVINARIYFVSPGGSDDSAGTAAAPLATIQKAAARAVAGDTVLIKKGVYAEYVHLVNSGTRDHPIVIAAYPGDTVTIDGAGVTLPNWSGLVHMSARQWIVIRGLRVINSTQNGIMADQSGHVTVAACYTYNSVSSGVGIWNSTNVLVDGNEVVLACNDGSQECISVAGCDTFEIRGNHVHDGGPGTNGGEGIDSKHGRNGIVHGNLVHNLKRLGIYVDAWNMHTYNIRVYQNVVHDCRAWGFAAAAEDGGLLENIWFVNNIAYHNLYFGLGVEGWGQDTTHPIKDVYLVNNTTCDNGDTWGGGIHVSAPQADHIVIRNNLLAEKGSYPILVEDTVPKNLVIDHNLVNGSGGTNGDSAVTGNPAFIDSARADFHLAAGSAAIDAGSATDAPGDDFDGRTRPGSGKYDIGAFEFGAATVMNQIAGLSIASIARRPRVLMVYDARGRLMPEGTAGRHGAAPGVLVDKAHPAGFAAAAAQR